MVASKPDMTPKTQVLDIGRETSALLGRPMPMHSRKKLQKKDTSAPIPKKYLEYEVSQKGVVMGSRLTEATYPGQAPQ